MRSSSSDIFEETLYPSVTFDVYRNYDLYETIGFPPEYQPCIIANPNPVLVYLNFGATSIDFGALRDAFKFPAQNSGNILEFKFGKPGFSIVDVKKEDGGDQWEVSVIVRSDSKAGYYTDISLKFLKNEVAESTIDELVAAWQQ
jgi:hypothetical protein